MKAKILLVDDEPGILMMVKRRLEFEGYEVTAVMNGEEALRSAREFRPDLVVLDVMLPGLDGYEVCRRIKADERLRMPVVMLSAMTQQKDERAGFECGADAYIRKPFRAAELLDRIKEFTAKGAAGSAPLTNRPV